MKTVIECQKNLTLTDEWQDIKPNLWHSALLFSLTVSKFSTNTIMQASLVDLYCFTRLTKSHDTEREKKKKSPYEQTSHFPSPGQS